MIKSQKTLALMALMALASQMFFPHISYAALIDYKSIPAQFKAYFQLEEEKILDLPNADNMSHIGGHALIQDAYPDTPNVAYTQWVLTTAYSSTPDQTDASPFITANGKYVYDGVIACNFLRFGTRVRMPQIYGDKIFVVEDRMAVKNSHKMDIWMSTREAALVFGARKVKVEILHN